MRRRLGMRRKTRLSKTLSTPRVSAGSPGRPEYKRPRFAGPLQSPLTDSNRRPPLYEEGPCVNWVGLWIARSGRALRSGGVSWAHLSIASWWEDKADWSSLRWRISLRAVRRPGVGGAFGSECFAAAEHVPDRFGESAGEVDLGDLGAALFADPRFCLLVAVAVGRRGAGV